MSFIEIRGIEDVKEPQIAPEDTYDLVIDDVKGGMKEGTDIHQIRVRIQIENADPEIEYAAIFHYLTGIGADDDEEKAKFKMLSIKRFLALVGVDIVDSGFNEEDLMGCRFRAKLTQEEYQGNISNRVLVPRLENEE